MGACASTPAGNDKEKKYQSKSQQISKPKFKVYAGVHNDVINDIVAIDQAGLFLTASEDGTVALYNALTGQVQQRWRAHKRGVTRIVYAPRTRRFYTCGRDKVIKGWKIGVDKEVARFEGHTLAIQVSVMLIVRLCIHISIILSLTQSTFNLTYIPYIPYIYICLYMYYIHVYVYI